MMTYGHVKKPTGAAKKRLIANGRVAVAQAAGSAARQRAGTDSRIPVANRVASERTGADGGVVPTGCIGDERIITHRCVAICGAGRQRLIPDGRIAAAEG